MRRFKTQKEFEEEYGFNWREIVGWNLLGDMDYLFGEPVDKWVLKSNSYSIKGKNSRNGQWSLRNNMVIEDISFVAKPSDNSFFKIKKKTVPMKRKVLFKNFLK